MSAAQKRIKPEMTGALELALTGKTAWGTAKIGVSIACNSNMQLLNMLQAGLPSCFCFLDGRATRGFLAPSHLCKRRKNKAAQLDMFVGK